jgi:hypothetical protein
VNGVDLLLGDAALLAGLVRLGAPKDHKAAIDLSELSIILWCTVCWLIGLRGWLLGLALLAEGVMGVALDCGAVFEGVLRLPPVERVGRLERLLEVLRACTAPTGLRLGGVVSRNPHHLPMLLLVLVPLIAEMLG